MYLYHSGVLSSIPHSISYLSNGRGEGFTPGARSNSFLVGTFSLYHSMFPEYIDK